MKAELEPMGRSIILPGCHLSKVGLEFVGEPTEETLRDVDLALQRFSRSAAWWHGDFLCARIDRSMAAEAREKGIEFETGDDRKGRMRATVRRYAEERGLEERSCLNYLCVANLFPLSRRLDTLSYSHHVEAFEAGLSLGSAVDWLGKAAAGKWSVRELRAQIMAAKPSPEVDEPEYNDPIPRELSKFECWSATRWREMQTVSRERAVELLGEMRTAVKLVDHLRRVAAGPHGVSKESLQKSPLRR